MAGLVCSQALAAQVMTAGVGVLNLSRYIFIIIYRYVWVYIYIYLWVCIHISIWVFIYILFFLHVLNIYIYIWVHVCSQFLWMFYKFKTLPVVPSHIFPLEVIRMLAK